MLLKKTERNFYHLISKKKKKSKFFLFYKLLVKLFRNMFPKFLNKIPIRSDAMSTKVNAPRFSAEARCR